MIAILSRILAWLEHRLGLGGTIQHVLYHPVPRGAGWWYVFGSATMTLLFLQLATGILLAMVYVPAADKAYESLLYLNYQHELGWFLRAVHYYGSTGMVIMMFLHMAQVFCMGAFKYPREMTWMVGVVLFLLTLGMAFTGQVLRWDDDAYWGIGVGMAIAGRAPIVGPYLVDVLLGGPIIAADSLSRFFALHVFILPGLLLASLGVHLYLVIKLGVSEPPKPGFKIRRETYDREYHEMLEKDGEPFYPDSVLRDMVFSAIVVITVVLVAAWLGPYGPHQPADPRLIHANPRPDWPFLSLFALASLCPPELETGLLLVAPVLGIAFLFAIPFIWGTGEKSASRRPLAIGSLIVVVTSYLVLTWLGHTAPWSPQMDAWSGAPVPVEYVRGRTPLEMQGAVVLQNKNCRNCHALAGIGGRRGPDLTGVGNRLNRDELIRQVIQGGGNMPAYGRQLSPNEVDALVAFLRTLIAPDTRPAGQSAPAVSFPRGEPPAPTSSGSSGT